MTVRWYGAEWEARIRRGAMQGVIQAVGIVENRALEKIMDEPKTGRVYKRRGVEHQASAPGEAPASDTGTLVNSRRTEFNNEALSGKLIFSSRHAMPLERGTRNILPRPFARPALAESRDKINAAITGGVRAALS